MSAPMHARDRPKIPALTIIMYGGLNAPKRADVQLSNAILPFEELGWRNIG